MRGLIILFIGIILYGNYKTNKIIEMIKEMESKKIEFLPIGLYNIFPINIDEQVDIKQYVKKQALIINLKAIVGEKAYINGRWYKKGDRIQNLIIEKITNNCVFFKSIEINKTFNICLSPNIVKVVK